MERVKTRKAAAAHSKKKTVLRTRRKPVFSAPEIAPISDAGEKAWQAMTALDPDRDDRWTSVEEHLLAESRRQSDSFRRWKYFAK